MISKFTELAGVEVTLRHLMHLFSLGGKCLVVKMDDKSNRQSWLNYFYVKTKDVVINASEFPKLWNYARKNPSPFLLLYFVLVDFGCVDYLFFIQLRSSILLWSKIFTIGLAGSFLIGWGFASGRPSVLSSGPSFPVSVLILGLRCCLSDWSIFIVAGIDLDLLLFLLLLAWGASRKSKAPTPMFCQAIAITGSALVATLTWTARSSSSIWPPTLAKPTRTATTSTSETSDFPVLHLVDESSQSEDDLVPRKK